MFSFVVREYEPVKEQTENGSYIITEWRIASATRYTVNAWPGKNLLGIEREKNTDENDPPRRYPDFEKKIVKVVPDFAYCYKLMKTQIRAQDGAAGLYKFIERETRDGAPSFFAKKIVSWIMDEMREARTA